jgi:hypothetical protein
MDRMLEAVSVVVLVLGGAAIVMNGAPVLEIMVVATIVVVGVVEWWTVRKLGKEARDVGFRLLFLVGVALTALGSF